jgi:CrcB protein
MKLLVLVAAGGAIGAALRFLTYQTFAAAAVARGGQLFPWATLTVNVVGSFLMGLAVVVILERFDGSPELRAFLMAGILGGFTTFSAFTFNTLELLRTAAFFRAAFNVLGQITIGLAALWLGYLVARLP